MRRTKILLALIAALLIAVVVISGCAQKSSLPPGDLLKQAQGEVQKAQAAHSPGVKKDYYQSAEKDFSAVAGNSNDESMQAQALYELGVVYQTAPGQNQNLWSAYNTFHSLVNKFDKPASELAQRNEKPEVDKILDYVGKAKDRNKVIAAELDKKNSSNILYQIIDFFVRITGRRPWFSYWFAIILITVIIKLLITPLTKAQFKSMKEMQKIAPLVKEIQEKYKGDQQVIGQKTMDLYKEHGINPFASCLPLLIQMPILYLLFYMIRLYQFQFIHGKFIWIGSGLSHWQSVTVPFGPGGVVWIAAANLSEPDLILVVLYLVSMYISTRLSAVDPSQADQQKTMAIIMPLMFAFIFAGYPSAFLLYWLVFNIIQTVQQYLILRGHRETEGGEGGTGKPVPATPTTPAPTEKPKDQTQRVRRRRRR